MVEICRCVGTITRAVHTHSQVVTLDFTSVTMTTAVSTHALVFYKKIKTTDHLNFKALKTTDC